MRIFSRLLNLLRRHLLPGDLKLDQVRIEFLPDALEIEERPIPPAAKVLLYAILGFFVCGVTWASLAEIDRIVTASGKIVTTDSKIVVQPMESATIRAINVHAGQVVEKGEILVSLDPTFTNADERSVRGQVQSAAAEIRRLEAELAISNGFSEDPDEQAAQAKTFSRFIMARDTFIRASEAEIRELTTHAVSLRNDKEDVIAQNAVAQQLEGIRLELYQRGNGSLVSLLDAQRQLATDKREMDRLTNDLIETTKKIETIKAKREASLGEMNSKAAQELQTARRDYAKAFEQIKKQERLSDLIDLRSPARAMVLELGPRSVGSVVKEGEQIVSLVALNVPVEIESTVDPKDISHLRVGDAARIKLDTLPYQKYGTLDGKIQSINGDVLEHEEGGHKISSYKVRIAITRNNLHGIPKDFTLLPGMVATSEIKVGTRRVMSYFLYPIIRSLDAGLREP